MSQDSSSGFKDSGIEERDNLDNSSSDIQQDFPSLPSSSGVQQVLLKNDLLRSIKYFTIEFIKI